QFDRLALYKKCPTDLCNRFQNQHPNLGFQESWKPVWTLSPGVPIGCRSPRKRGPYCMPIHMFAKRLERGRFVWPSTAPREGADMTVTITPAQLGYLLEGIDWRLPQHTWRPQAAG